MSAEPIPVAPVAPLPAEAASAPAPAAAAEPVATEPVATEPAATEPAASEPAPEVAAPVVPETTLAKFTARLPDLLKDADHGEMWGVELVPGSEHVPSQVILQKFLRANSDDVDAAAKQLVSALQWRKKIQPTKLVTEAYDRKKFGDLGYVTIHKDEAGKETIITWNIYGAVKDNKATFGNIEEFIKWRSALMELSVQKLNLNSITALIPEGGEDPYQMVQVHDYKSVSFFKMDPAVKAASKETIQVMSNAYPELLVHKYFVNVPAIMGWMYGAMKLFLAPATLRKFHPMRSGTTLAVELKSIAPSLPKDYGGQGAPITEGFSPALMDVEVVKKDEIPEGSAEAPVAAVTEAKHDDIKVDEVAKELEATKLSETKPEDKTEAPVEAVTATEVKPVTETAGSEQKTVV